MSFDSDSPTRRDFLRLSALASIAAGSAGVGALNGCSPGEVRVGPGTETPPIEPLNILVLGGTQFIGPHLVEYALERGHNVTLFNRGRSNTHLFPELEKLVGDRDNEPAALAVLEDPNDESGSNGPNYGAHKAAAEREARAAFPDSALVIRPGLIVGPGDITDRFGYWAVRMDRGGDVLAPGDGTDAVQFIDVRDLMGWTVRMIEGKRSGTYNATGPYEELAFSTMLAELQTIATNPSTIHWADAEWLAEHEVNRWSDMPVWIGSGPDTSGFLRRNISKALEAGLTFRPMLDTAMDTLGWHADRPEEERMNMRSGLSAEREAELIRALQAS